MPPEVTVADFEVLDGAEALEVEPEEPVEDPVEPVVPAVVGVVEVLELLELPDEGSALSELLVFDRSVAFELCEWPFAAAVDVATDDLPGISLATAAPTRADTPTAATATDRESVRTLFWAACLSSAPVRAVGLFIVHLCLSGCAFGYAHAFNKAYLGALRESAMNSL